MSSYSDPTPGIPPAPEDITTARTRGTWRKRLSLVGVLVVGASMAVVGVTSTGAQAYSHNGVEANLALESTVLLNQTSGSTCPAGSAGPEKAIDGLATDIYNHKWCSMYNGDKSLVIDLGEEPTNRRLISGFRIKHAGFAGENPLWNTRGFSIYTKNDLGGAWNAPKVYVNNNTANESEHRLPTLSQDRYVQLLVSAAVQPGGGANTARIYEFQVLTPQNLARGASLACTGGPEYCEEANLPAGTRHQFTDVSLTSRWCGLNGVIDGDDGGMSTSLHNENYNNIFTFTFSSPKTIQGYRIYHASTGGENSFNNTKSFVVRNPAAGFYGHLAGSPINNNTGGLTEVLNANASNLQAVQVEFPSMAGEQQAQLPWPGDPDNKIFNRIYEIEIYGY